MDKSTAGNSQNLEVFYQRDPPRLNQTIRAILTEYSHIAEHDLVSHTTAIRDKAWEVFKYPCIGSYFFLNVNIAQSPEYSSILSRLKASNSTSTLLDLGCCFAQDIRKLIVDDAPGRNLTALEYYSDFLELGYDLFRDRHKLQATLVSGDFFASDVLSEVLPKGGFDFIHAASFFHLFSRDEQSQALDKAVRMLKPQSGSMIFGRQLGSDSPRVVKSEAYRSGETYMHSEASWVELVSETAKRTGTILITKTSFEDIKYENQKETVEWKRFWFSITME